MADSSKMDVILNYLKKVSDLQQELLILNSETTYIDQQISHLAIPQNIKKPDSKNPFEQKTIAQKVGNIIGEIIVDGIYMSILWMLGLRQVLFAKRV